MAVLAPNRIYSLFFAPEFHEIIIQSLVSIVMGINWHSRDREYYKTRIILNLINFNAQKTVTHPDVIRAWYAVFILMISENRASKRASVTFFSNRAGIDVVILCEYFVLNKHSLVPI